MSFRVDYTLLPSVMKIVVFSIVTSWIITTATSFLLAGKPENFTVFLELGLSVATIVPILVALPVSYYILMQRQKIEETNEKLAMLLRFDQLTLMLSRRAFFREAETAIERLQGRKQHNAMFFLDVDRFKQVNDRFGHAMGDEVLRLLGKMINEHLQPGEIAGRMGGEEFCIFAQDCPPAQALSRAQQLVDKFRSQARIVDGKDIECTLSIGIAISTGTCDLDKLISKADRLLYIAKQGGRDCVAVDEEQQITALTDVLESSRDHQHQVRRNRRLA